MFHVQRLILIVCVVGLSTFAQGARAAPGTLSVHVARVALLGTQCRAFFESYGVSLPVNGLETCNAWCAGFKALPSPELVAIRAKLGKHSAADVDTYLAEMPGIFDTREWLRAYEPRGCRS